MPYVNKLVNPTPWKVEIPYDRSAYITIQADGEYEFLNADMQKDFEPSQPGAEEVKHLLDQHGLFLLNPDLSYDLQVLRALRATYKAKKTNYDEFVSQMRANAMKAGQNINEETLEEAIQVGGYGDRIHSRTKMPGLRGQLALLSKRIKFLEKAVENDPTKGMVKDRFDPDKTCFVTNPPRQFSSPTALAMFLEENPEIKEKHEQFVKAQNG